MEHEWPGNIRELENMIERCMIFAEGSVVHTRHLPPEIRDHDSAETGVRSKGALGSPGEAGLKVAIKEATLKLERQYIVRALEQTGGNVTHTARLLKISRKSLQNKMKELGLRDD